MWDSFNAIVTIPKFEVYEMMSSWVYCTPMTGIAKQILPNGYLMGWLWIVYYCDGNHVLKAVFRLKKAKSLEMMRREKNRFVEDGPPFSIAFSGDICVAELPMVYSRYTYT